MIELINSTTQDWLNDIQDKANHGYFVVSGWINEDPQKDKNGNIIRDANGNIVYKSGHVTVIVPGNLSDMKSSTSFGGKVPFTMDTGYGMREKSQKISLSYGSTKVPKVVFYYYK